MGLVAVREVAVPNREGLHARPVSNFIKLALTFRSDISVSNATRRGEAVDGKSAMQMMLLNAAKGCILRIEARGDDAEEAVEALMTLVQRSFDIEPA